MTGENIQKNIRVRNYPFLRGIDMQKENPTESFSYLENMYVDYESGGKIVESVPGFRRILSGVGRLHSIAPAGTCEENKKLLIHEGDGLFYLQPNEKERDYSLSRIADFPDRESTTLSFADIVFISDGQTLYTVKDGELRVLSKETKIAGCKIGAIFDRRLFLCANPQYPSKIFYSEIIEDGFLEFLPDAVISADGGGNKIKTLLTFGNMLWVFKESDRGEGSILCIERSEDEKYTICNTLSAPAAISNAISFDGRILYPSRLGIMCLESPNCRQDCKIKCISTAVAPLLKGMDKNKIRLGKWKGYAALFSGEKILLLDTRGGKYEWYFLSGVGGHQGDKRVFRYLDHSEGEFKVHATPHEIAKGEVFSYTDENGRTFYYSKEGEKKYSLYPTDEFSQGEFLPPTDYVYGENELYFATENGAVYLFNRDKKEKDYYLFDRRTPRYVLITQDDDCELAGMNKNSLTASLDLDIWLCDGEKDKAKPHSSGVISLSVIADGMEISKQKIHLAKRENVSKGRALQRVDKELLSLTVSENSNGWKRKRIEIFTEDHSAPFGLKSLCFRYHKKD